MLRTGVTLLFPCSIAVIMRSADVPYFDGELVRSMCLAGLGSSFVLLMGTYLRSLQAAARKRIPVVESMAWKRAPTA